MLKDDSFGLFCTVGITVMRVINSLVIKEVSQLLLERSALNSTTISCISSSANDELTLVGHVSTTKILISFRKSEDSCKSENLELTFWVRSLITELY